jgi:hypothetical protein
MEATMDKQFTAADLSPRVRTNRLTTTSTSPQGASNADQLNAVERAIEMALYYPSPQDNG